MTLVLLAVVVPVKNCPPLRAEINFMNAMATSFCVNQAFGYWAVASLGVAQRLEHFVSVIVLRSTNPGNRPPVYCPAMCAC